MKILITSLPDIGRINAQRPHHIINHLSRDNEITVLCVKAWWLEEVNDSYRDEKIKDINLLYMSDIKINPVFQELNLIKNFNKLNKKYGFNDCDVHINLNSLIAGYYIAEKLKSDGIPTVFDVADDLPEALRTSPQIPRIFKNIGHSASKFMFNKMFKVSYGITLVTVSLFNSYNFPPDKSRIIPNGVDTELFSPDNLGNMKKELGIEHEFILGFHGVLSEWVDLEPTFIAIKRLIDSGYKVKMLIIGDGDKLSKFKQSARQQGISENVMFIGKVPTSELPKYISCMDVCMVSRKTTADSQNSFPLKLLEYMASSKPVISSELNGIREIVGNDVLYATSSNEIENAVIQLYHDKGLREKMGYEGMKFVHQKYKWQNICGDFENVLRQAVNEHAQ